MDTAQLVGTRLLSLAELEAKIGRRHSQIYADIKRGVFPAPIRTGENQVRWVEAEINRWIVDKIAERDAQPQTT